ncbi:MAG TPA: hypothetical protein VKF42_07965 [Chitinivibrionales bacterium]|jgi:hypothetical protein|nr:hypothetical protein [Chitinivibrionales bacterium]
MNIRKCALALFVVLMTCAPNQVKPLLLTILQPRDGDTVHTDAVPIEGLTTVGAIVHVSETEADTGILFAVDDTGHFAGHIPIPADTTYAYSAIFKVRMGALGIEESRTVYYRP